MTARERRESSAEEPRATSGRTASEAAAGSPDADAQSPAQLRRDIDQTREDLGDTVVALSHKADIETQAKDAADQQKARLRAKAEGLKERLSGAAGQGEAGADAGQRAREAMSDLAERTRRQPLSYLGGALAVGALVGRLLLPRRRRA